MATRLFFAITTAADVSPAFSVEWTNTTEAVRRKLHRHMFTAGENVASGTQIGPWTPGQFALDRQYVSAPLEAQTIAGNIRCQIQSREHAITDNVFTRLKVYVVDNAGTTVRGTLLAFGIYGPVTELLDTGFRNKIYADDDNVTSVGALAGDRLVVEIGYSDGDGGTPGTTPEATSRWGAQDTTNLTPNNEVTTAIQTPWIEFSHNLLFQGTMPVTVNRPLENDFIIVDSEVKNVLPVTVNRPSESDFVAISVDPFVRNISPIGVSPCVPALGTMITFTVGTVLPRTVDLTSLVITVQYGVNTPITVYDGGAGGFQPGFGGTVTHVATVDEDLYDVVILPSAGFPESTPITVRVVVEDDLSNAAFPVPTWLFLTCLFLPCLLQRAYDSGTQGYVYWLTVLEDPSPDPEDTFPNFTGTLSAYCIILNCPESPNSYYQRAFDSGTNGLVYWRTSIPTPSPSVTTPAFTGTLSSYVIMKIYYS